MDFYLEMKDTLDSIEEQMRQYRLALESSFDQIDIEISLLNVSRREILLEILRDALKKLDGIDQAATSALREESISDLNQIHTLEEEISTKIVEIADGCNETSEKNYKDWVTSLRTKISVIDTKKFVLNVSVDNGLLRDIADQIQQAFYLKTSLCDPLEFEMEITFENTNRLKLEIINRSDKAFNIMNLKCFELEVESQNSKKKWCLLNLVQLEQTTLLCHNKLVLSLKIKSEGNVVISVKVMDKHIIASPVTVDLKEKWDNVQVAEKDPIQAFFSKLDNHYENQALKAKLSFSSLNKNR